MTSAIFKLRLKSYLYLSYRLLFICTLPPFALEIEASQIQITNQDSFFLSYLIIYNFSTLKYLGLALKRKFPVMLQGWFEAQFITCLSFYGALSNPAVFTIHKRPIIYILFELIYCSLLELS